MLLSISDLPVPRISFQKLHPDAALPVSASGNNTGYDVTAVEDVVIPAKGDAVVPTGIKVADCNINMWYLVLPRSGLGFKKGLQPHLGVIDSNYRGDLGIKLYNFSSIDYQVKKGDRIAQLAFFPLIKPEVSWSDTVTETERGANGFGSTDTKQ